MHPNLLDQLRVFQAVVEGGSFAAAARALGRAVSAISYAINALEEQLAFQVFDRSTYRVSLTPEGQALLNDAEILLRRAERWEARARSLREKVEAVLPLIADPSYPEGFLVDALKKFEAQYPLVTITVRRAESEEVVRAVREEEFPLGIMLLDHGRQWDGIDGRQVAADKIALVAAPDHPLAQIEGAFPLAELENHRQIHLHSGAFDIRAFDYRVHRTDVWGVDTQSALRMMIEEGLGWGFMPEEAARPAIEAGRLAHLNCDGIAQPSLRRFAAVWTTRHPPGKAGEALVASLLRDEEPVPA